MAAAPASDPSSPVPDAESQGTWAAAPEWEDDTVPECRKCLKPFKLTRRRHHCRGCGRIFCDDCSSKRFELPPAFELKGKQRVCDECYYTLVQASVESNPDLHPPRPDVEKSHALVLERVKAVLAEPEETWHKKFENKCVKIFSKKMAGSSLHLVRTVTLVPCPLEKAWSIYNNKALWSNWQPDLKECRTIEKISDDAEFMYVLFLLPVLDNRDMVSYNCKIKGTVSQPDMPRAQSIIGTTVQHPLCPPIKGVVRADVRLSMTSFEPVTDGGVDHTRITTILHVDIKGLVPPVIVNQAVASGAGHILDMVNFMVAYKEA